MTKASGHLSLPTPWQQVTPQWCRDRNVELFIKRDDMIHPIISGNKWRKLKGIVGKHNHFSKLITYGGAYSNHLVATAKYCQIAGVNCEGIVRGEKPKRLSTVLDLCSYYGMRLTFISRSEYREQCRTQGLVGDTLYVPEGGSADQGIEGCSEIITENMPELDQLFVACGTGTTLAGLSLAKEENQLAMSLTGVSVLKSGEFLYRDIAELSPHNNFRLLLDYHFGGYAKTSIELMRFIQDFAIETNVLLDPIYTAKAAFAVKDLIIRDKLAAGSQIGLIHTGGLTGWYGKWTELLT
ncbi:MAG: pyridoxal-phosphate dependent enzyme [Bacteroidia bacterium]